jgi:hypothetical protein
MNKKSINMGSITIKPNKFREGYYLADTLYDYEMIKSLELPYSLSSKDVDVLITKASEYGFDVRTIL